MKTPYNFTILLLIFYFLINCSEKKLQTQQRINISIIADTSFYVNNELVKIDDLESRLKELYIDNSTQVTFTADSLTHMGALYKAQRIYQKIVNKNSNISENSK